VDKYLEECMISFICGFVRLGSTDLTLPTETVTLAANMCGDLALHGIVGGTSIAIDAKASGVS
jgi:hypothetical protein